MKKTFLFSVVFSIALSSFAQPCPKYGKTNNTEERKRNRLKNTGVNVSDSREAEFLPLRNLLPTKKRVDKNLYMQGAYVYTEGYLTSHEEQGPETCNCNKASKANKTGDVHMYLSLVTDAPKKNSLVVEITPAFKKKFPDYDSLLIDGTKIRVFGFLFYDTPHEGSSFTTCKKCGNIWRKTCWEIHPITFIQPIEEPDN